jgi:dethiobiotin synthetase
VTMTLVVVTGTGTEIGKTYVAAALARALRAQGVDVHARKPVQSFDPNDTTTDAHVLAAATGEPVDVVCAPHRRLPTPMAPPMAADALGVRPFVIADLVGELNAPGQGITLVEGAGGLLSPLADDGDTRDLIDASKPAVVILVADARLGTINLVRLCVAALGDARRPIVFLNRFDGRADLHVRNSQWLRAREGLDVVTDIEALASRLGAVISR